MYLKDKYADCRHTFSLCLNLALFLFFFAGPGTVDAEPMIPLHIKKGTNLISLARQYCVNESAWKTIAKINKLKSPYIIYADSTLHIPLSLLVTEDVSARVASISGSPRLIAGSKTVELQKGDLVLPGQTVITGSDEYVHIIYPDNKHTGIGPESEMTLVYLLRLTDNNLQAEFSLKKGKITHSLLKKLKINEHFETRTPVAITGVRGTEFRLKVMDSETNIIETLRGRVAVSSSGKQLLLPGGKGSKVRKGHPPAPPRQLPVPPTPPALDDVYRTLPVVIPAPDHPTAAFLHLRITTDTQGRETIKELTARPGGKFFIPAIADGQYQLFLTAVDNENFESVPSPPAGLYVRTFPAAPIISKPNNGLKTFDPNIKIRWLKSDQAAYYSLQLATDPKFSDLIDEQQVQEASFTTGQLAPGDYFFRVRLIAEDGFSTLFSVPLSWKVIEQPKLDSPEPVTAGGDGIQLRWPATTDVSGYMLQVAEDKSFTNLIVNEEKLTEPSYTITNHLNAGKYYVRICSVMDDGQQSPWTPPQTLTIDPEPFGVEHIFIALGFIALMFL